LIDPNDTHEHAVAEDLNHKLVNRALSLGGTCTGEHGIGLHKMDFLLAETGEGAVDMMRTIKRALDQLTLGDRVKPSGENRGRTYRLAPDINLPPKGGR
jgi:hypothetical protein